MYKNLSSALLLAAFCSLLFITSCKKKKDDATVTYYYVEKTIALNKTTPTGKDSLLVTRDKLTANLRVTGNTQGLGVHMKRMYIFTRTLDNVNSPGSYQTVEIGGFKKDANNNFYYVIDPTYQDSTINDVTVTLRTNVTGAVLDEFYFVYTTDADYAGPGVGTNIVLGAAQFFIVYGKLNEYKGYKIYNYACPFTYAHTGFDIMNYAYKVNTDPAADFDIAENTDDSPLFLGKFKSLNGTSFVKADSSFSYANATDTKIGYYYSLGKPFTETPDSIKIGDVYLIQLRGDATQRAAIKITYIVPENGKTGSGYDNEYFLFNLKR